MIDAPWVGYLLALLAAGGLCVGLTPLAIKGAVRFGILDRPGGHKGHETPTPYLGGVAIVVAFAVAVGLAAVAVGTGGVLRQLVVVLSLAVTLAAIGLLDDLIGLPVWLRVGAQVGAAIGLWSAGIGTNLFGGSVLDAVVTVVWVVGITNALNLLDNMDALSAGVATIAALAFGVIAALNGQILVGSLSFALAGCAAGFLVHNRPPARIYMGDAGSLFLGFLLATLGLKLEFDAHPVVASLVPILVLTVPVMDTTLVTVARLRHGLSPFQGGRDHLSHRLVQLGLPVKVAVLFIAVVALAHGWVALLVSRAGLVDALLAAGLVALLDLLLFGLVARVPVYAGSRGRDLVITERRPPDDPATSGEAPRNQDPVATQAREVER